MTRLSQLRSLDATLADFIERRAQALTVRCEARQIAPRDARLTIMWGGGKDSTLAVIFGKIVADIVGCTEDVITMVHPGLSPQTVHNIRRISELLGLRHEWRAFVHRVAGPEHDNADWIRLYRVLAFATDFHPRFMCIACNFGSTVVELQALVEDKAHFRISGNPPAELRTFDDWTRTLAAQLSGRIAFPDPTGKPQLDYYRAWWAIYAGLLGELDAIAQSVFPHDESLSSRDYLYALPDGHGGLGDVESFTLLADENVTYAPIRFRDVLGAFDWRLPDDIQAGTESDCLMPAAIAALDIEQHGLDGYLAHLDAAATELHPFPEMRERARSWASSGRSSREGRGILAELGLDPSLRNNGRFETPIADALVGKLLPVR